MDATHRITFRRTAKKTDDGRTLVEHDQWQRMFRSQTPAQVRAEFIAHVASHRRNAARELAMAAEYERAAAEAATMVTPEALIEDARFEVIGRLNWAVYFLDREHLRHDTWPVERREDIELVRAVVVACEDIEALTRWSVICEYMPADWSEQLTADVLNVPDRETIADTFAAVRSGDMTTEDAGVKLNGPRQGQT